MRACSAGSFERWDLIFHDLLQWVVGLVLVHTCADGRLERWHSMFQDLFPCFILYVLMHCCAGSRLERWGPIFQTFFLCFIYIVFWRIPAQPEASNDKITVQVLFSFFIGFVLMHSCAAGSLDKYAVIFQAWLSSLILCFAAFLRYRKPCKLRSHRPIFVSVLHRLCFDSILRCTEPWHMRSHLPSLMSTNYNVFSCIPAPPGALKDAISSSIFFIFDMMSFYDFLRWREAWEEDISSSKLYSNSL